MNIELISKGIKLELEDNTTISLNYAIQDILDTKKRKTNFSKTIKLKGTDVNNQFFESIYDVNISSLTFNPRKKIETLLMNGLNEIFSGSLNLINISNTNGDITYETVIVGELGNIYGDIKGLTVNDLDLSEFDHIRNKTNIIASWDNTEGYIYPYIVYGKNDNIAKQIFSYNMLPALYTKTIFDKMISELGYTYESKFLNSDYFKKLILTYGDINILKSEEKVKEQTTTVGFDDNEFDINLTPYSEGYYMQPGGDQNWVNEYKQPLSKESGTSLNTLFTDDLDQYNLGTFYYKVENTGYYNIEAMLCLGISVENSSTLNIEPDSGFNQIHTEASLVIERTNGSITTIYSQLQGSATIQSGPSLSPGERGFYMLDQGNHNGRIEMINDNVLLEVGDIIKLYVGFSTKECLFRVFGGGALIPGLDTPMRLSFVNQNILGDVSKFSIIPTNQSMGNEFINLNSLFSIKLDSLFDDLVKMFNLVIIQEPGNHLVIETYDNYFSSKNTINDWTDKVDRKKPIDIKVLNRLNYNEYVMTYSNGKEWLSTTYFDLYDEVYGTREIDVINDFSKKTETLKLKLESTPNSNRFIGDRSAPFLCKYDVGLNRLENSKTNTRMLFIDRYTTCDEFFIKDFDDDLTTPLTVYPYCGMLSGAINPSYSLSFGTNKEEFNTNLQSVPSNNLFNQFHRNKLENITNVDSRLMTAYIHLTEKDIAEFDFRDIIFIDGSYWRVDNIADYNPLKDGTSKVTLYKLLDDVSLSNINIFTTENNQSCPFDIVSNGQFWISNSGLEVTAECCTSLGGSMWQGQCSVVSKTNDDKPPLINKGNLTQHNGNTILSSGSIVVGSDNYIGENASPSGIFGTGNVIADDTDNVFIVGNGNTSNTSNTIITQNIVITGSIEGVDIIWEDLVDLLLTNDLSENGLYNITDRNIRLWTLDNNTYNPYCTLFMDIIKEKFYDNFVVDDIGPRTLFTHMIYDNKSTEVLEEFTLGNPTLHYCIWNGKMWKLVNNTISFPVVMNTLDEPGVGINWTIVNDDDTTAYYYHIEDKGFTIIYDLVNDKIFKQIDNRGNELDSSLGDLSKTDWGCNRIYNNKGGSIFNNQLLNNINNTIYDNNINGSINNNRATKIYNNTSNGSIHNNDVAKEISNNQNNGSIYGNLINENTTYHPNGIEFNSNNGDINGNISEQISNNSCWKIYDNVALKISENSSNGNIYDNVCDRWLIANSNIGDVASNTAYFIRNNSNNGPIVGNTITNDDSITRNFNGGAIFLNVCEELSNNGNSGLIRNNTISGTIGFKQIQGNVNAGDIRENVCFGINGNSNTGFIGNNDCQQIENNSNNGGIYLNVNQQGYITGNSNSGDIYENDMPNGNIEQNSNNGIIYRNHCQSHIFDNNNNGDIRNVSGTFQLVFNNKNNGSIDGSNSFGFSITDPIVTK